MSECSICLSQISQKDLIKTICNHEFHKECAINFTKCPLCRKEPCHSISLKMNIFNTSFKTEINVKTFSPNVNNYVSDFFVELFNLEALDYTMSNYGVMLEDVNKLKWNYEDSKFITVITIFLKMRQMMIKMTDLDHESYSSLYRIKYMKDIPYLRKIILKFADYRSDKITNGFFKVPIPHHTDEGLKLEGLLLKEYLDGKKKLIQLIDTHNLTYLRGITCPARYILLTKISDDEYTYGVLSYEFHTLDYNPDILLTDLVGIENLEKYVSKTPDTFRVREV